MTNGRLELIQGPMFSGKTHELIRRLRAASSTGRRVLALKPSVDVRHRSTDIASLSGSTFPARLLKDAATLPDVDADVRVVGLDELQFCDVRLVAALEQLRQRGLRVVVAGLDRDFRGEPFATVASVGRVADVVDTLTAICDRCGKPATLTQRVVDGSPAPLDDTRIRVGGRELYEARCEACYRIGAARS